VNYWQNQSNTPSFIIHTRTPMQFIQYPVRSIKLLLKMEAPLPKDKNGPPDGPLEEGRLAFGKLALWLLRIGRGNAEQRIWR